MIQNNLLSSNIDKERILEEDFVGSEHYISPEMLSLRESHYSNDLWAFGVIVYQMITGELPFKGKS